MELLILDTNLKPVDILDQFESLIWTDRFYDCGEFEIYTSPSEFVVQNLKSNYYLYLRDSDHLMIIEDCKISDNIEDGGKIIFSGRSVESILDRRIVWKQTILTGSLQDGIERLLNENVISPEIPERIIPNFIFEASDDPVITALTIDAQFTYTNLFETIRDLCVVNNIGFKVTLSDDMSHFIFKLYTGKNRSYDQTENPYVIFSQKFENIINVSYSESQKNFKNVTLVAGEGEGLERKTTIVGNETGLSRRELYTDARDLSQETESETLSNEAYLAQLYQRGQEHLAETGIETVFDGQIDSSYIFKYGEDFFLGDIVQLVSNYGIEAKAKITEIIYSEDLSGVEIYPSFKLL